MRKSKSYTRARSHLWLTLQRQNDFLDSGFAVLEMVPDTCRAGVSCFPVEHPEIRSDKQVA